MICVRVGKQNGIDAGNPLAQCLLPKIRRGIDQNIPVTVPD
jgi:hypothetical protein